MDRAGLRSRVQSLIGPALASLRVVGLTYAGLGGIVALGLVVAGAVLPVAPVLHQATDPAGALVSGLVQPTTDAVAGFINMGPSRRFARGPQPVAAAPLPRLEPATAVPAGHDGAAPDGPVTVSGTTLGSVPDAVDDQPVAAAEPL